MEENRTLKTNLKHSYKIIRKQNRKTVFSLGKYNKYNTPLLIELFHSV